MFWGCDRTGPADFMLCWSLFFLRTVTAGMDTSAIYSSIMSATPLNTTVPVEEPPKKKRRETPSKPRAPARPYRRLEAATLETRMKDLVKKMSVLRSKLVLLEDRFEGHEKENNMRIAEDAV